jgi:GTPase Era involved in 16S rRNA processing
MPTITEQINGIIDRRVGRGQWDGKGRLQQIEKAEGNLDLLRTRIESLNRLLVLIEQQKQEQRGEYYVLLQKDPEMDDKLRHVSTVNIEKKIKKLQQELTLLKIRFSRESVQIAFVGEERQGKSTFIQAISGLRNDVIPAYNGSSCTGAVSIIHNAERFKALLTFYEVSEFLENVNSKLRDFYPKNNVQVSSLDELAKLDLSSVGMDTNTSTALLKFRDHFVKHVDDYRDLLGHAPMPLTNPDEVSQYVAQYRFSKERPENVDKEHLEPEMDENEKEIIGWKELFFKYVAVKSADIYNPFSYQDSGKIVLVDTVGLGPQGQETEKEMYRVLREDCDAAIDLFKPSTEGASFNENQSQILTNIAKELGARNPEKWLVYVLNKMEGEKSNMRSIRSILQTTDGLKDKGNLPVAWVKAINGFNRQSVIDDLVVPLLNLVTSNIDDIDACMLKNANSLAEELYNEYIMLCKCVNSVLSSSIKTNQNLIRIFEGLYKELKLSDAMKDLDDLKFEEQEKPCKEIEAKLSEVTEEAIFDALPNPEEITREVKHGTTTPPVIFDNEINEFRNRIFDIYENVNVENLHPLQEEVKMQMIRLFFNEGMLKNIPLSAYNVDEGPSVQWLNALVEETIDPNVYPQLHAAMKLILDYQINIEGLIEYNVAKSVHIIDTMHDEFYRMPFMPLPTTDSDEQSNHIFQEIFNRITHIQQKMREWIGDFSMIPSHSFYARVHKVREKLFLSPEGNEQLRYYYLDNISSIWSAEISGMTQVENAFGEWNRMCKSLNKLLDKKYFEL